MTGQPNTGGSHRRLHSARTEPATTTLGATPTERWERTLEDVRTIRRWRFWRNYSLAVVALLAALAVISYRDGETATVMGCVVLLCLEVGWLCDIAIDIATEAHNRFTRDEHDQR